MVIARIILTPRKQAEGLWETFFSGRLPWNFDSRLWSRCSPRAHLRYPPSCLLRIERLPSSLPEHRGPKMLRAGARMTSDVLRELRAAERFQLRLPVNFSWPLRGQQTQTGEGLTRDISSRGLFVSARNGPRIGASLRFEFNLAPDDLSSAVQVEGKGQVVRVEHGPLKQRITGFAVRNLSFTVRELQAEIPLSEPGKSRRGKQA